MRLSAYQWAQLIGVALFATVLIVVLRDAVKHEKKCWLDRTLVVCQEDARR